MTLYKHCQEREESLLRFHATIHGATFDDDLGTDGSELNTKASKSEGFFKDPKEYEHMTQEEKETETQKMMGVMKHMAKTPKRPGTYFSGIAEKQDG